MPLPAQGRQRRPLLRRQRWPCGGEAFLEKLELTSIVVHVGDIRTCVLHPASTTHRQLSDEAQLEAGILPELIRVSVGLEDIADIIADFDQALAQV